jgi:hypothetical protein
VDRSVVEPGQFPRVSADEPDGPPGWVPHAGRKPRHD